MASNLSGETPPPIHSLLLPVGQQARRPVSAGFVQRFLGPAQVGVDQRPQAALFLPGTQAEGWGFFVARQGGNGRIPLGSSPKILFRERVRFGKDREGPAVPRLVSR